MPSRCLPLSTWLLLCSSRCACKDILVMLTVHLCHKSHALRLVSICFPADLLNLFSVLNCLCDASQAMHGFLWLACAG